LGALAVWEPPIGAMGALLAKAELADASAKTLQVSTSKVYPARQVALEIVMCIAPLIIIVVSLYSF
jgi:2-methylcitrate dehydratase PrpD